jgi:hypothetical protein
MAERVVLVTGSLAEPRLRRISEELIGAELDIVISNVGVKLQP